MLIIQLHTVKLVLPWLSYYRPSLLMKLSLAGSSSSASAKPNTLTLSSTAKGKQTARLGPGAAAIAKKTSKPVSAFGNDNDDDDASSIQSAPVASTSSSSSSKLRGSDPTRPGVTGNASRLLKKLHNEAEAVDPSIFAYDEVYDSMKAGARSAEEVRKNSKEAEKPKYVSSLLKAAEVRKNDRIRAEDKLIEREREKEGDEFRDKDAFVTDAYKQQQEELRRAEEEERKREGEFAH